LRFPLDISAKGGELNIRWKGWVRPRADDDSIWQGTDYWGSSPIEGAIKDVNSQLEQNKNCVYICVGYNARAVSRQRLRLYVTVKSGASAGHMKTRKVDKDRLKFLYQNEGLEPWLKRAVEVEEVEEHIFYDMMRKVNPVLNQSDMWMLTETFMGITGNCYWWKRPNMLGVPYQIWIKETQYMRPKLGKTIDEYIKMYVYELGIKQEYYDPKEIVHHKYPNPYSMAVGLSPIEGLSDPIKVNENIYNYERATFKNMARPDTIISIKELGKEEFKRFKKDWEQMYGGAAKAGQAAILEGEDIKVNKVSISPRELSHLEGRKMTMEEIANGYGIPLVLLSPEKSNKAVAQTAYVQYMRDTIDPKLKLYEQKINEQLLPDYEGGENLFCAFDNCMPDDRDYLLKEKESNLKTGYSSINIERQQRGEEEVEWGERPILPATMTPLGSESPPKKSKEEEEKQLRQLADAVAEEIYRRDYK